MANNSEKPQPSAKYQDLLAKGELERDRIQSEVVQHLQRLYDQLVPAVALREKSWHKLARSLRMIPISPIQGLYLWGSVGRGKTFLIDLFFESLPFKKKLRLHFHRFMRRVHQELGQLKGVEDPLDRVAKQLAREAWIICFDELFVSDITDAMLLGRLFDKLFSLGITLVATSNIPPKALYANGLQRQQFLPAIALLEKHLDVYHIDSDIDYRMRTLTRVELYHVPADQKAHVQLEAAFIQLAPEKGKTGVAIEVENRQIMTLQVADDVVWFDFYALCDGPRSQVDYIEIARCYHTVLISNVPLFTSSHESCARRFIAVIDEFYDRHVKLLLSAEMQIEQLYQGTTLQFEFQRTISRLTEMQSKEYLGLPHLP